MTVRLHSSEHELMGK